jgi:SH3-like domain-containing protein
MRSARVLAACAALMLAVVPAFAESLGPVTNLPMPRFVSMKAGEANVRRGPSLTHRVDWVFRHPGMPLIVTGEYGHWRRVVDRDGVGGWIHYALLSGSRTVIIDTDTVPLRIRPLPDAPIRAHAERGVVARLGDCEAGWCRITAGGERGWVPQDTLWGLDPVPDLASTD